MNANENNPAKQQSFLEDAAECWAQLPHKAFFFPLLAAWLLLFQFYGNGTFGYIDTTSLMVWMQNAYSNPSSDGQDGHGDLIVIAVIALFWWKRRELLAAPLRLWWPGLLMIIAALLIHVLGYMVQQPRISIVALFLGLYGLMGLAWGPAWLRKCFFPFFLFVFCIPIASIAEPVTFPLRVVVAKIVAFISNDVIGLNVLREGTQLFNAKHTYSYDIAAACSGLQSLVAIFALSTIYAFLFLKKPWKQAVMIMAALPLSMLSNVCRLMFIILAAELFGKPAGDYVHASSIFSMLPYVPGLAGVWLLGTWLEGRPEKPDQNQQTKSS